MNDNMNLKITPKKCLCGNHFKCKENSPQEWCSIDCRIIMTSGGKTLKQKYEPRRVSYTAFARFKQNTAL